MGLPSLLTLGYSAPHGNMAELGEQRRLAAIFAADMVGYSRLMEADERGTIARQKAHRAELIDPKITEHHGRIVKTTGDGMLVEFASVVDAVECAVAIQRAMVERERDVSEARRIQYRVGINLGDIVIEGDDIFGDGVNIAARLQEIAEPGGVRISGTAYDHLKLTVEVGYEFLGERQVKNIEMPVRVYRVLLDPKEAGTIIGVIPKDRRSWIAAAATAGLVAVIAAGGLSWWQPWVEPAGPAKMAYPLPDKPSIAVLPFQNLSDDPQQAYFADGMAEDLITDLTKISGLFVIARNSSFAYKGRSPDLVVVARELGVRYVLEGSVRRIGQQLRINIQLVDAATGGHIWAERFDGTPVDVFLLQDEITKRIVDALAVKLTSGEQDRVAHLPTNNLEAYDYYLRAERGAYRGDDMSLFQTLPLYEKAIALDGDFAEAYAGLAWASAEVLFEDFDNVLHAPVARKSAYEAATRAVELQPDLPRPYSVLSLLQMIDGKHDEAIASAAKAVDLGPNDAEARINLARVLTYAGSLQEAIEQADQALRLNPKPPPTFLFTAGWALFLDRQYERATQLLERGLNAVSTSHAGLLFLAMNYAELGRVEAAKAVIDRYLKINTSWSLAGERAYNFHQRNEYSARQRAALRKAGLPEWPFGFEGRPEDRLDAAALENMVTGREWNGRFDQRELFFLAFLNDGSFALRTQSTYRAGTARVRNRSLCLTSPSTLLGRELCGPVYRNPEGTAAEKNEYVYVNGRSLFEFSIAQ